MQIQYYKEYSHFLNRDMEFKVYGSGGKPVLAIPCQNGRFYDWENFGMLDTLRDYLEGGAIQLFTIDTIDGETLSKPDGDPHYRAWLHEQWFQYVIEEFIPRLFEINGTGRRPITTGFSMGAYHAANFYFRRPDIFDGCIALSGLYDTDDMYAGAMDDIIFLNDPCRSIAALPPDHPYIGMYNAGHIIICVGQGAWEEQLIAGTRRLDAVIRSKGIDAWIDYWGYDVNHDWPWWKIQIRYFLPYVLED